MKIKITYQTDQELQNVLTVLKPILNGFKLHKSDTYKSYKMAYITTRNVKTPSK